MLLWLVCMVAAAAALPPVDYTGYMTLQVGPLKTDDQVDVVDGVLEGGIPSKVMMLEDVITTTEPITLIVAPTHFKRVRAILRNARIVIKLVNRDLQKQIDAEKESNEKARLDYLTRQAKSETPLLPEYYMNPSQTESWVSGMAGSHAEASVFTCGTSYEGRTFSGVAINAAQSALPAVWIDAGIHAREWIAPATAVYIIHRLLTGTDADAIHLKTNYRWFVCPQINPDGNQYTHSGNRVWRKNTRPSGGGCFGTDCNRNWDFNWRLHGTSTDPCQDTYGGSAVFSEPETSSVANTVMARRTNMILFISMHSFSQLWLVPWAGIIPKPSDINDLMNVGNAAGNAIFNTHGRRFAVGTAPDLLYAASGGTFDWAKDKAGVKYSYTPELRPRTIFDGGFVIPATNIRPSGEEIFAGVNAAVRAI